VTHGEAEPGRDLLPRRKHKFSSYSISLRDDLMEQVDRFAEEELPFSSRSAAISTLVAMGLKQWERQQEKPRNG